MGLFVARLYLVYGAGVILDEVVQVPPVRQAHLQLRLQPVRKVCHQRLDPEASGHSCSASDWSSAQ